MSMSGWQAIINQANTLESLAIKGEWEQVNELGDALSESLKIFFDTQIVLLTAEEQAQVKQEGNQVVTTIYTVLEKAKQEKKKINLEAGKMAQGKRGVSAYKNT